MSLSKKVSPSNDTNVASKAISLNPNAAEFIPFSLRKSVSPSRSSSNAADASAKFASSATVGKAVLGRSESSVSNASDEEAHRYWSQQLPDDITPDFKVMGENNAHGLEAFNFSGLSLHDGSELARFTPPAGTGYALTEQQEPSPRNMNGINFTEKLRYAAASYGEDPNVASFLNAQPKSWDKQIVNSEEILGSGREVHSYNSNLIPGFMNNDIFGDLALGDEHEINPLEFLALQFPGFAAESLADVYFANGCDLHLTVEMLTQLELQVDGGFNQNMNPKTTSVPNLSAMDFPALSALESQINPSKFPGEDLQQSSNPFRSPNKDSMPLFNSSSSFPSRSGTDFASAVRKLATKDSGIWKFDRNGSGDSAIGSSRSSNVLASAYSSGQGRSIRSDKLQGRGSTRPAPVWLETGESVANLYSEMREDARDHARLRNAYFEQARQAYLIGNKALAKELSAKGQLHNMHMKSAHGKAQESIYRMRNPVGPEIQGNGKGYERMIDLHGLHVSEAIHVLKHELAVLRSTARAADQRLQVYICIGTGHHTRGSRTPARLPIAVQRYLLEEEGLDYTEPTPGLLRVVIY